MRNTVVCFRFVQVDMLQDSTGPIRHSLRYIRYVHRAVMGSRRYLECVSREQSKFRCTSTFRCLALVDCLCAELLMSSDTAHSGSTPHQFPEALYRPARQRLSGLGAELQCSLAALIVLRRRSGAAIVIASRGRDLHLKELLESYVALLPSALVALPFADSL